MMNEGAPGWLEIYSKNPDATLKFLAETFGTRIASRKESAVAGMDYAVIRARGQIWPFAGVMGRPEKDDMAPHAMIYLTVRDCAATHKKMVANGAKTIIADEYSDGMKFGIYVIPGGIDIGIAEYKRRDK